MKVQSLHKSYGNKEVLKGIDLTFEPGKVYGIVGENGAGKTTLFKSIAGLTNYSGEVNYDGVLKDVLGYLPTTPHILSRITGEEYLRLMTQARNIDLSQTDNYNLFDLPLEQFAENYSTGMKKKLALTAILLQKNDVFILDEPFNGVDIQSNILIKDVLRKLKQLNKTVLLSSHIFSTLSTTCDQLHYLKDGKIVQSAFPEEFDLIEKAMLAEGIGNKIEELDI